MAPSSRTHEERLAACRRGGQATLARYGPEHYRRIAKIRWNVLETSESNESESDSEVNLSPKELAVRLEAARNLKSASCGTEEIEVGQLERAVKNLGKNSRKPT